MKIYLASRFSTKELMQGYAKELESMGFTVTSRWLQETGDPNCKLTDFTDSFLLSTAITDIEDMRAADIVVLFTVDPTVPTVRGGRHFESGFAYGIGKPLLTVGPLENIFHFLPNIANAPDWEKAKQFLLKEKYIQYERGRKLAAY